MSGRSSRLNPALEPPSRSACRGSGLRWPTGADGSPNAFSRWLAKRPQLFNILACQCPSVSAQGTVPLLDNRYLGKRSDSGISICARARRCLLVRRLLCRGERRGGDLSFMTRACLHSDARAPIRFKDNGPETPGSGCPRRSMVCSQGAMNSVEQGPQRTRLSLP